MDKEDKKLLIMNTASHILVELVSQDYSEVRNRFTGTSRLDSEIKKWAGLADKTLCEAALGKAYELVRQFEADVREGFIELE